jgi:hypothetical protein
MLALAITFLFTIAGLVAMLVIADSLIRARAAWARLIAEGGMLRAGLPGPVASAGMGLRPVAPARRAMAVRRPGLQAAALRQRPLQVCVAA